MKIDKNHFETATREDGKKIYSFKNIADGIGAYVNRWSETWFELDSLEKIGWVCESDSHGWGRTYFNAQCIYGWDGTDESRNEVYKNLCTRATYSTAFKKLLAEYRSRI